MQDREFDELFRAKLRGFESAPSDGLWANIAAEVIVSKPDRPAWPFIGIAASILILISAGVFFLKPSKVKINKPEQIVAAHSAPQTKTSVAPQAIRPTVVAQVQQPVIAVAPQTIIKRPHVQKLVTVKQDAALAVVNRRKTATKQQPLAEVKNQPDVLMVLAPAAQSITKPDKQAPPDVSPVPNVAVAYAQLQPVKVVASVRAKKHGISTFGDLINVVVASVDKRKDKLIEFSDKDEDESLITGLNLGIVKVKKEEVIATNK